MSDIFLGDTQFDKLVEYTVVYRKPGQSPWIFRNEEIVTESLTERAYRDEKRRQFLDGECRLDLPTGMPPISKDDAQYVQVSYRVLARYPSVTGSSSPCHGKKMKVPKSGKLLGALDARTSQFGDEFRNFPEKLKLERRPAPGGTFLSGWIAFTFGEYVGKEKDLVKFKFEYLGVGTNDHIQWGGGQEFRFFRDRAFPIPPIGELRLANEGILNLKTGEVAAEDFKVNAIFQNTLIATVDRINLIPFAFPFTIPLLQPPAGGGPSLKPPFKPEDVVSVDVKFEDDSDGTITGFRMECKTAEWVTVFPRLVNVEPFSELFAPFSFGPNQSFHFANPTECLPGTPEERCPDSDSNPKGLELDLTTYFHPHFNLNTLTLGEVPEGEPEPPRVVPEAVRLPTVVSSDDAVFVIGGLVEGGVSDRVFRYSLGENKWHEHATLPHPVYGANGIYTDGQIYVIGGWHDDGGRKASKHVQLYDVKGDSWVQRDSLLCSAAEAAAGLIGGFIHVVGGWTVDPNDEESSVISDCHQIYRIDDDVWKTGPATPLPTASSASVVIDGALHVMGGRIPKPNPNGCAKSHSVVVAGGNPDAEITDPEVTKRVSVFDPTERDPAETDSSEPNWAIGVPLSKAVYDGAAGLSEDGRVFLVGGRRTLDGDPTNRMQARLPELDETTPAEWRNHLRAPIAVTGCGAAVVANKLVVVGGSFDAGGADATTDLVQIFSLDFDWAITNERPLFTAKDVLLAGAASALPPKLSPGGRNILAGRNFGDDIKKLKLYVDDKPAELLRVLPGRGLREDVVEFLVPEKLKMSGEAEVRLEKEGAPHSHAVKIPCAKTTPSVFVYRFGELREKAFLHEASALAQNETGLLNCPSQPAKPGEKLTVYLTGIARAVEEGKFTATLNEEDVTVGDVGLLDPASIPELPPDPSIPKPTPPLAVYFAELEVPADFASDSYLNKLVLKVDDEPANPVVVSVSADLVPRKDPIPWPFGLIAVFNSTLP